jgi:hypothetical protein
MSSIPSVGPTLENRLQSFDLVTVKQMKELNNKQILIMLTTSSNQISQTRLAAFRSSAGAAIPGPSPAKVDFQTFDNPYLAKYGDAIEPDGII